MGKCRDQFCRDVVHFINPSLDRILKSEQNEMSYNDLMDQDKIPILLQFGDSGSYRADVVPPVASLQNDGQAPVAITNPNVPIVRKFRRAMDQSEIDRVTTSVDGAMCYAHSTRPSVQPIISIVSNYQRHFQSLNGVTASDIPWHDKQNFAVYRGALTGRNRVRYQSTDLQFCEQVPRCNFVYQYSNSSLVDAKLVPIGQKKYPLSDPLNGITMFSSGAMSIAEMLQYKAIVMLEGNDVSSGLKWALFSNSVVVMQAPMYTSWAMEELLQPWVHYIPILDDFSDVEQKVQWILDHDEEAQKIARNGRLWMADLVYHPDAVNDNEWVIDETLQRYRAHFLYNPSLKSIPDSPILVEA
jgi:Glycosyl transferase family 90